MEQRMEHLSSENEEILRLFIIAAACIGAILTTIFSLTHGILEVYPFLYILPIILAVYFYPRRAVIFSLGLSLLYICLVYLLGFSNSAIVVMATAWFAIFITIAVVASSYANRLQEESNRIKNILENSQDGIFYLDLRTRRIREINAKCAHWLRYDRKDLIGKSSLSMSEEKGQEQFLPLQKRMGNRNCRAILPCWYLLDLSYLNTRSRPLLCSHQIITTKRPRNYEPPRGFRKRSTPPRPLTDEFELRARSSPPAFNARSFREM